MTNSQHDSSADMTSNTDKQEALQQLLSHVESRQGAPEQVKARIKHNVKTQWRASVAKKHKQQVWWYWGTVATACSVAVVFWINSLMLPAQMILNNLQLHRVQGQVKLVSADGNEQILHSIEKFAAGARLETLSDGMVTLTFNSGGNLRLNNDTSLSFNGENEFTLNHGIVYFDSGSALNRSTKLTLHTQFGDIQNLGTQFAVSSAGESLEVWVREGKINLAQGGDSLVVGRGEKLLTNGASEPTISKIGTRDLVWQWVNQMAPEFELEGQNLNQFLIWLTREYGLTLAFDSAETKNMSHVIILHGEIDGLDMQQSLETVFATVDLQYELQQDTLVVYR